MEGCFVKLMGKPRSEDQASAAKIIEAANSSFWPEMKLKRQEIEIISQSLEESESSD